MIHRLQVQRSIADRVLKTQLCSCPEGHHQLVLILMAPTVISLPQN